jgi:sortase A
MKYRIQVLGWTLIWSGLFVFGYLGWQIYGTDWVNRGVQEEASAQLEDEIDEAAPPPPQTIDPEIFLGPDIEPPPETPEVVEFFSEESVDVGESFAFLSIPRIGIEDVVVYEGVDRETLKKGPGHMTTTPLPGQPGNAVISGHRTTYGRPFFDFDLLATGDRVELRTEIGTHVYEVREVQIVEPTDVWVTDDRAGGWLTMTTCHPKFSARQRLVVWAEMVDGPNATFINVDKAKSDTA